MAKNDSIQTRLTREQFEKLPAKEQMWVIYGNTIVAQQRSEALEGRIGKLEKRKRWDTAQSGAMGIFGGFLAMILKAKLWQ